MKIIMTVILQMITMLVFGCGLVVAVRGDVLKVRNNTLACMSLFGWVRRLPSVKVMTQTGRKCCSVDDFFFVFRCQFSVYCWWTSDWMISTDKRTKNFFFFFISMSVLNKIHDFCFHPFHSLLIRLTALIRISRPFF